MNNDIAAGKRIQFVGRLKELWGRLTDDDRALYEGQRDQFLGRVQKEYGLSLEHADERLKELEQDHAETG